MKKKPEPMRQIVARKTADLIPFVMNARTHDDAQVAQIAASIKEFGFTNPVLIDEKNGIIAGHGRVLAARKLNMEKVPCIVLAGLSEAQRKAYVLADNKLALNAGWDFGMLREALTDLDTGDFDMTLTGFSAEELEQMMTWTKTGGTRDTDDDADEKPEKKPEKIRCPFCKKTFDPQKSEK